MKLERSLWSTVLLAIVGCSATPPTSSAPIESTRALATAALVTAPATRVKLSDDVTPEAYRLTLSVDPRKPRFSGKAEISVKLSVPEKQLVLHGRDLHVSRAVVHVGAETIGASTESRKAFGQREGADELVLTLEREVARGDATLEIDYDAPFGSLWGLYRTEVDGASYAFTQLESIEARRMFPGFDEPRFKTPFRIVLDVPSSMKAVSNAPIASSEARGESTRVTFAETAPLPTYLVAVAVGDLEIADGPKAPTPVRLVTTKGRAHLGKKSMDVAAASLGALEKYFGRSYPYGKLDIAAVPDFAPGAMENAGLVTFREDLLLADEAAPASMARRQRYVVAHELAHQWFGDLVTMRWWDDLWLNEGFATWMQAKACDAAFPGFGAVDERVNDKTTALAADLLPAARAVRPKVELHDQIYETGGWSAYQKGSSILTMVESWVGEEAFRGAIHDYIEAHANGSVTSNDLFAALDAATKKPVSKVAASFLDQPGVPFVDVALRCDANGSGKGRRATIDLTETELTSEGVIANGTRQWTVPVCLRLEGVNIPVCTLLGPGQMHVRIENDGCPKYIVPNAGEAGYYRYRLDPELLDALAHAPSALTARERAGLIADTWALATTGTISAERALDVLRSFDLTSEKSKVVLDAELDVLAEMNRTLVDDASRSAFERLVHRWLDPQKKRRPLPTKLDTRETDEARLARVLVWAALFDLTQDATLAAELEPVARAYLGDPASVDADLATLALRVSARAGGAAGTGLDGKRLAASKTPAERVAITVALASKRDPAALRRSLDLFLTGEIRAGDVRHLKNGALRTADAAAVFYPWMMEHFDTMNAKLGGAGSLTSTLAKTCDATQLDRLSAFFVPLLPKLEGAQRGYDEGMAEAKRCLALRTRDAKSFGTALGKIAPPTAAPAKLR